ncbi:MAG TPA: HepT-like ribonuclease domain-containing protein [Thermomicrobiales bacterium]|nr:HepT-like ribonuclease domain-containing protein [Thermomicrobiales bacterium]
MTLRDHTISMRRMLDHARMAIKHTTDRSLDDVERDEVLRMALVRMVEVVGEAANRVPPEIRTLHPGVPWRQVIDTRNRLIHGHDTVDIRLVYEVIQHNLPPLVAELERILEPQTES